MFSAYVVVGEPPTALARTVPTPSAAVPQNAANIFNLFNQIVAGLNTSWCDFDLYTITIFNGTVLRYTTADFDINVPGLGFFTSQSVRVDQQASKVTAHWKVGLDVDVSGCAVSIVIVPGPFAIVTLLDAPALSVFVTTSAPVLPMMSCPLVMAAV